MTEEQHNYEQGAQSIISDLCFDLAVAGNAVDTFHVFAQRRQVEKHSVCKRQHHVWAHQEVSLWFF